MSATAPRIEARAGYTYLTYGGRRLRVTKVTAARVDYYDLDHPDFPLSSPRSFFEAAAESVVD